MRVRLGGVTVRVHPLLPLLWLFCLWMGSDTILPMGLALLLHESGHLLAARVLGLPVEEIEITPMGGVISMARMADVSPMKAFLLAAAGPVSSLFGCLVSPLLLRFGAPFSWAQTFARGNLLLLLINQAPALPLDGGHMLRSLLSRWIPYPRANRLLTGLSYLLGGALGFLSLIFAIKGRMVLSPAFAGLYLLYAAAQESRQGAARYVTALIARRQKIERGEILPVQALAVSGSTPASALLPQLSGGKYHIVYVLSPDGMKKEAMLEEKELCDILLQSGNEPLSQCIKKRPGCAPGRS